MIQSIVPNRENDPLLIGDIPDHFLRQYKSQIVSRRGEIKVGDLGELRCFALGVYLINRAA